MRRIASAIATSIVTLGLMATAAGPAAAGLPIGPTNTHEGPQEAVSQGGPVAVLEWRMPERYHLVPKTFNEVNPTSWKVEIDTCRSYSKSGNVNSIRWKLYNAAGSLLVDTTTCKRMTTIASLGRYRVVTTVTATDGTVTNSRWIELKDHLIVVAGDSMASGEGNPDAKGDGEAEICGQTIDPSNASVEIRPDPYCIYDIIDLMDRDWFSVISGRPSTWNLDPDCHRSYRSGMALAARDIEKLDPRSSVTFVNVACSGAEVKHMFSDNYDGLYTSGPWDTGVKPPQADQIAALVCGRVGSCDDPRVRAVDGLFLSIGINNLSLSEVLKDCMKPDFKQILGVNGCHDSSFDIVDDGLASINFGGVSDRFAELGVPIKSVYHAQYPEHVFEATPTGCGVFVFVNSGERAWLQEANEKLNTRVRQAHSNDYHWRPVWRDWTNDPWRGHGYCAGSNRYFVSLFDSVTQYNGLKDAVVNGAVHPNAKGHEVFRQEFLNEYQQRTRRVTDNLIVSIEGVQVKSVEKSTHGWLMFGPSRQGTDGVPRFGNVHTIELPEQLDVRSGTWIDLRNRNINLALGINDAEKLRIAFNSASTMPPLQSSCENPDAPPPGVPTLQRAAVDQGGSGDVPSEVPCIIPVFKSFKMQHLFSDGGGWGIGGSRTATDSTGNFIVRYHVSRQQCPICGPMESAPNYSTSQ
jgi:hypothetical protein